MKRNSDSLGDQVVRRVHKTARRAKRALTTRRVMTPPPSELRLTPEPPSPLLLELRAEAAHLQAEIAKQQVLTQDHPTSGNHMADDASEVFEQTKNLALKRHLERTLEQVELAIARVQKGTYGKCEKCGAPIPAERLEAIPYATTCVACARPLTRPA